MERKKRIFYVTLLACSAVFLIGLLVQICLPIKTEIPKKTENVVSVNYETDNRLLNFSRALIINVNNTALWALNFDGNQSKFVKKKLNTYFDYYDIHENNTVLLYGESEKPDYIRSMGGKRAKLKLPWQSKKIALDCLSDKVYSLDAHTHKVDVFDASSEYHNTVHVDFENIVDIALDPARGLMFILQSHQIIKANMDGTKMKRLARDANMSAFAIDRDKRSVYWSSESGVKSIDYAGTNHKSVTNSSAAAAASSLAVIEDTMFWLKPRIDSTASKLWTCRVQPDGSCSAAKKKFTIDRAVELRAYHFRGLGERARPDPCSATNDCQHLCVLSAAVSGDGAITTCACHLGWRLKDDLKSCEPIDDFLLYFQGDVMRGVPAMPSLRRDSFVEAIMPRRISNLSSNGKNRVEFDYAAETNQLVYAASNDIYIVDENIREPVKLLAHPKHHGVSNIVIDSITKNLFYTLKVPRRGSSIMVYNIDSSKTFTESEISRQSFLQLDSMTIHPDKGYVFFTHFDSLKRKAVLTRMYFDGKDLKNLRSADQISSLRVDLESDRLYWLEINYSEEKRSIFHANLDQSDLREIVVISSWEEDSPSISLHEDWLYLANSTTIWRLDKVTGKRPSSSSSSIIAHDESDTASERRAIGGMKIVVGWKNATKPGAKEAGSSRPSSSNPCAIDNGNCPLYCFVKPNLNEYGQELEDAGFHRICDSI
ncbi:hypothetical protein TKK_0006467 [Trichogramma kaykai]